MNAALTAFGLGAYEAAKQALHESKLQELQDYYDNLELFDNERDSKEEDKVSVQQKVEDVSASKMGRSKRNGSNNKQKTKKVCKSASS